MASLNSTITITGTIGGRKINFSHTYTMEDVYDVGSRISASHSGDTGYIGQEVVGQTVGYVQNGPNYMMVRNANTQMWQVIRLTTSGVSPEICLPPLQTMILTSDDGMLNLTNAAGETTMLEVNGFDVNVAMDGQLVGNPQALVAFNAIT